MRRLFGIAIEGGNRVNSLQCGYLNYQTLIAEKDGGNPACPFRCIDDGAGDNGVVLCGI